MKYVNCFSKPRHINNPECSGFFPDSNFLYALADSRYGLKVVRLIPLLYLHELAASVLTRILGKIAHDFLRITQKTDHFHNSIISD